MTPEEAFFTVHRDLYREGPGTAADVHWALSVAGIGGAARVCDAACGPGADTVTLAEALPHARIDAVEMHEHFVQAAGARLAGFGPRVQVRQGDMTAISGPYDLIWCAGALYFPGVTEGLRQWRAALAPSGRVAFSEPVLLSDAPSDIARAFWEQYPAITGLDGIVARVKAAGFRTIAHRIIVGAAWAEYFGPMRARIAALRQQAPEPALAEALDENAKEIAQWEAAPDEIAYALLVVEPAMLLEQA
ncbi:MAG: class I SAM-dependent methyltransferase [Paracoccaceae bacterium]